MAIALHDAAGGLEDRNVPEAPAVQALPVSFPARDGRILSGTVYQPECLHEARHCVVFNAGAGLASSRYRRFVTAIAQAGLPVLAYDYRGVVQGESVDAGLEHWSEFDHAGALDFVVSRFPGYRIATISHSIGCMVAAAAPNAEYVHQMVFVAPHVGYWGDYRAPWRYPMWLLWHAIAPAVAYVAGSFPAHLLRLGDRIPARLMRQWGALAADAHLPPSLMAVEVRERMLQNAARLALPALVITFEDDAFVGASAVPRFIRLLAHIRPIRWHLDGRPIGHWGYFRRRNADMWAPVVDFLLTPLSHDSVLATSRPDARGTPC